MALLRMILMALLVALPATAAETYDLIFRMGTLGDIPQSQVLVYDRQIEIATNPDYAARNTGVVELNFEPDDMARLRFVHGDQHRVLGMFPATVGNPIIMYFVETVLRDVAQEAGGSPFYIRNRIKESLVTKAPINDASSVYGAGDVAVKQISLFPFKDDKNRDKMGVYGDLELIFTMSKDVPGWYRSLSARAPAPDGSAGYSNTLTLLPEGSK